MSKTVKKNMTRIVAILMALFAIISMISPCLTVNAEDDESVTHARVSIAPLNNTNTDSVDIEVVEEDQSGWRIVNQWENNTISNLGKFVSHYCGASASGEPSVEKESNKEQVSTNKENSSKKGCVYLSFPGQQYSDEHGITSADVALASNVSSIMTDSFEKLMELINKTVNSSTSDEFSISNVTKQMMKLVEGQNGTGKGSFTLNGYKVEFIPLSQADSSKYSEAKNLNKYKITDGYSKGTTAENYCVVVVSKGSVSNYEIIQFSVPKGYSSDQYNPKGYDSSNEDAPTPVKYISMKGMAYYAARMEAYGHVSGSSSYKLMYGDDDNIITNIIKTMFNSVFNSLYKMLGCEDVVSIIFNRGARSVSYYEGVTPYRYLDVAQIFFWISMVVASFMMFYSIYLVVIKHSLADISPAIRMNVKDSIKNLIYVIIMEVMFVPTFSLMCRLNGLLVSMFSSLIGSSVNLTDMGGGSIGVILFSFLTFGMTIALNVRYTVRSIVTAVCYGVAPIAIASVSIDTKHTLFNTWLKELVANIFLQTFNAVILAFLLMITTSSKGLMRFIILYSFIPLNKWFMEDLMGARTGASMVSKDAMGSLTNAGSRAMNAAGAATSLALEAKNSGAPRLTTSKNAGNFDGSTDKSLRELKGYTQSTGDKKMLTDGSTVKNEKGNLLGSVANASRTAAFAAKDIASSKAASDIATGLAAFGVAGATLAGANVNPNLIRQLGSMTTSGFRRRKTEQENGFSGVRSGFAHIAPNGNVDGIAFNAQERSDFEADHGNAGSWMKADIHKVDGNQISTETMNALKGNQERYFSGEAGAFKPTIQSDTNGNDYVISASGVVPNMQQKQATVQSGFSSGHNAASKFGLSQEPFAKVASTATKEYGYDSVSNAMAVSMPTGTIKYALNNEELSKYQSEGGVATGMVQASQLSPERFSPIEMKQLLNDDSYTAKLGANEIVKIDGKPTVISDIGETLPNASNIISSVQSDVRRTADLGYEGAKLKSYAHYDYDGRLNPFLTVDKTTNKNGETVYTVFNEYDHPGDTIRMTGYGKMEENGEVKEIMSPEQWNALDTAQQESYISEGWGERNFVMNDCSYLTTEQYQDAKENPWIYTWGDLKTPINLRDFEETAVYQLSDNFQVAEDDLSYRSLAEKAFNKDNVQANARFIDDYLMHRPKSIIIRKELKASPPNVNGIVGSIQKEERAKAKRDAEKAAKKAAEAATANNTQNQTEGS